MPDTSERVSLLPEAAEAARDLAAAVSAVAASLPFGTDPAGFLAALERLAAEDEETTVPVTAA